MEIHVKEEKARREKSVSAKGPGMKMPSCRSAAVGFLPVISRLHHYRICRSEEKQSAAASLTCCWVLMLARLVWQPVLQWRGDPRVCLSRSDEVAWLCEGAVFREANGSLLIR